MGNLGQALTAHKEFEKCGMEIIATFDTSPLKIGRDYFGKRVFPLNKFKNLAQRMNIKVGIITTPAKNAQEIADMMVDAGIKGNLELCAYSFRCTGGSMCPKRKFGIIIVCAFEQNQSII